MVVALTVVLWHGKVRNWQLALIYFTTALPFFVSGTILSLVISETVERVDRVYFFDLRAPPAGCLLLVPFLDHFGGLSTVIAVGVLFAAAAAVWHSMAGSVAGRAGLRGVGAGAGRLHVPERHPRLHRRGVREGSEAARRDFREVEQLLAHRHGASQTANRTA